MSDTVSSMAASPSKISLKHDVSEVEDILQAIRTGVVDAVVIETVSGDRVYALQPFEKSEENHDIIEAIKDGRIDALVVQTAAGNRVLTLQGSDEPYRVLVETMQEGAATIDAEGAILYSNSRFAKILGLPAEESVGASLYAKFAPPEGEKLRDLIREGLHTTAKGELRFKDAQGRNRVLHVTLSPLPNHGQSDINTLCLIATDVTELFEATESLRQKEEALRHLSTRLLQSQDEERMRISRELHDSAGQYIAAALMRLGAIEELIPGSARPNELRRLLVDAQQALSDCSREVRTLSYLLHPPTLDVAGLPSAIQWYSDGFAERSGISVELEVEPALRRLPQELEMAIYRVVQESLTNIHRHSGSKWARIRLVRDSGEIVLEVTDRGKGIGLSPDDPRMHLGVGISGMRERVRQFGGNLVIESGPQGTRVRAAFPLPQATSAL